MVDQAGASQDAPVSMRPVRSTLSGSTTHEIDLSGGGDKYHSSEVALWLLPSPLTAICFLLLTPRLRSPLITMSTQHPPWRKMTVC
ncbi:ash family protein [Salmonella enterica]|nr:ash family protein [Salmonella enterica]MBH0487715.1 ash family protein [Salmonella enterica]MBH5276685.1 ash family protein [Salmonella enterica]MBH5285553.1 ash family protein [Salmonella enterica]